MDAGRLEVCLNGKFHEVGALMNDPEIEGGVAYVCAVMQLMGGPSNRPNSVLVCAARTLNATGQARVTLSLR